MELGFLSDFWDDIYERSDDDSAIEIEVDVSGNWKKFRKDVQERIKEVRKLPREELIRFYGKMKKKYMELFPESDLDTLCKPLWLTATKMEVAIEMGMSMEEIRGVDFSNFPEYSTVTLIDKETKRTLYVRYGDDLY